MSISILHHKQVRNGDYDVMDCLIEMPLEHFMHDETVSAVPKRHEGHPAQCSVIDSLARLQGPMFRPQHVIGARRGRSAMATSVEC